MSGHVRFNAQFPRPVADALKASAKRHGLSLTGAMVRALGIAQALDAAAEAGHHVGVARDREALDTVLLTPTFHQNSAA